MSHASSAAVTSDISSKSTEIKPVIARHETFHPRNGWLKKGLDKLSRNPDLFFRDDGPTVLGVGKNMAKSIRYWLWAFKLTTDEWKGNKAVSHSADWLTTNLLDPEGLDPFLEDPASLWLLHWNLLKPPCHATAWNFVFNHFREQEFSSETMFLSLKAYLAGKYPETTFADNSLRNDISCLIRMYARNSERSQFSEDTLDCPFASMGLLTPVPKSKEFRFVRGSKPTLPDELIVVASLEFIGDFCESAQSVNISRLLYEPSSPGSIFKIGEREICNALEAVSQKNKMISMLESAGRLQLFWKGSLQKIAVDVLSSYYRR